MAHYASQRRDALLALYEQLQGSIDELDKKVAACAEQRPQARLLMSHPGKQYPVLRRSNFITLLTGDTQQPNTAPNTYVFARTIQGQGPVLVALNNGSAANSAFC